MRPFCYTLHLLTKFIQHPLQVEEIQCIPSAPILHLVYTDDFDEDVLLYMDRGCLLETLNICHYFTSYF